MSLFCNVPFLRLAGNNVSSSELSRGLELTGFGLPNETMSENDERFRAYLARQRSKATSSAQLKEIAPALIAREWRCNLRLCESPNSARRRHRGDCPTLGGLETGLCEDKGEPPIPIDNPRSSHAKWRHGGFRKRVYGTQSQRLVVLDPFLSTLSSL